MECNCIRAFPDVTEIHECDPDETVYALRRLLDELAFCKIPNETFSVADLEVLLRSLVKNQRDPGEYITWGGNWSLVSVEEGAPSDIRVAWIFFPSYLVVSIMSYCWLEYPDLVSKIEGYYDALLKGLHFISARQLFGHGIEGEEERLEAVNILVRGHAHDIIAENKDHCDKCHTLYTSIVNFKEDALRNGRGYFTQEGITGKLSDFPPLYLNHSDHFLWRKGEASEVIVETQSTSKKKHGNIVSEIAQHVAINERCSLILPVNLIESDSQAVAKQNNCYDMICEYQEICSELKQRMGYNTANKKTYLHLIIRAIGENSNSDINVTSSSGLSCKESIHKMIVTELALRMKGYSRRQYKISHDITKEFNPEDYATCEDNTNTYPQLMYDLNCNTVEICFRPDILEFEHGRITDVMMHIVSHFHDGVYKHE